MASRSIKPEVTPPSHDPCYDADHRFICAKPFGASSVLFLNPSREDGFWDLMSKLAPFVSVACQGGEFSYHLSVWSLLTKKLMICDEGFMELVNLPPKMLREYSYETPGISSANLPPFAADLIIKSHSEVIAVREKMISNQMECAEFNIAVPTQKRVLFAHVVSAVIRDPETRLPIEQLILTCPITPSMFFGRCPLPDALPTFHRALTGPIRHLSLYNLTSPLQSGRSHPPPTSESTTTSLPQQQQQQQQQQRKQQEQGLRQQHDTKQLHLPPQRSSPNREGTKDPTAVLGSATDADHEMELTFDTTFIEETPPSLLRGKRIRKSEGSSDDSVSSPEEPVEQIQAHSSPQNRYVPPASFSAPVAQDAVPVQTSWRYKASNAKEKPWSKNMQKFPQKALSLGFASSSSSSSSSCVGTSQQQPAFVVQPQNYYSFASQPSSSSDGSSS